MVIKGAREYFSLSEGGHTFLQQAETVRLVSPDGEPVSVTSLKPGDVILGYTDKVGRHTGIAVNASVEER